MVALAHRQRADVIVGPLTRSPGAEAKGRRRAVAEFVANLKAGEGFSPELRVHKLVNTEIWSLPWAKDGRALFRYGPEGVEGETHIIWEAIGTHDEANGRMR